MPVRVKCGGTEGEIVVAHGCWKRKKLICDTEGEIVVAHGRLPSPAPEPQGLEAVWEFSAMLQIKTKNKHNFKQNLQSLRFSSSNFDCKKRNKNIMQMLRVL